jgi:hypothetical protein
LNPQNWLSWRTFFFFLIFEVLPAKCYFIALKVGHAHLKHRFHNFVIEKQEWGEGVKRRRSASQKVILPVPPSQIFWLRFWFAVQSVPSYWGPQTEPLAESGFVIFVSSFASSLFPDHVQKSQHAASKSLSHR